MEEITGKYQSGVALSQDDYRDAITQCEQLLKALRSPMKSMQEAEIEEDLAKADKIMKKHEKEINDFLTLAAILNEASAAGLLSPTNAEADARLAAEADAFSAEIR